MVHSCLLSQNNVQSLQYIFPLCGAIFGTVFQILQMESASIHFRQLTRSWQLEYRIGYHTVYVKVGEQPEVGWSQVRTVRLVILRKKTRICEPFLNFEIQYVLAGVDTTHVIFWARSRVQNEQGSQFQGSCQKVHDTEPL